MSDITITCVCDGDCTCVVTVRRRRGTSNSNRRGSSKDRHARKLWLLETFRADVDVLASVDGSGEIIAATPVGSVTVDSYVGSWTKACRCYRCGRLLTYETLTVDRIRPGCEGGTYRRNNIRPACAEDNSETGGHLGVRRKRERKQK